MSDRVRPDLALTTESRSRSRVGRALLALAVMSVSIWRMLAIWHQVEPPFTWPSLAAAAAAALAILVVGRRRRLSPWLLLVLEVFIIAVWWSSITPLNDRNWAADVAHGVTGEISGSQVTLRNVRNFEWRSAEDFMPRWATRRYDLNEIGQVDLISSVWANPAIAHTLISFGFSDGRHLVFSAEIRREEHESFSEIGGFFREFELVMIAAEENDIVRLRTNIRKEEVSLFPLEVTPEQARALFLSYLGKANELAAEPRFYHTITTNCTTVIFQLAQLLEPRIPTDWRILFSGYLPDYLHDLGVIRTDRPLQELKREAVISDIARQTSSLADYSRTIRSRQIGVHR